MIDLDNLSDLEVLTLTLIGEARGEPIEGQVAVACVVRNRVNKYNKSYGDVCLQPKQFSCWNENDPNRNLLESLAQEFIFGQRLQAPTYIQCQFVARGVIRGEIIDNTHGSLNYLTLALWNSPDRPFWAKDVTFSAKKGNQVFFTAV